MSISSSISVWPVIFNSLSATTYQFDNGLKFSLSPALSNAQDLAINHNAGLILSDLLIPSTFLSPLQPDTTNSLTKIISPLVAANSSLLSVQDNTQWILSASPLDYKNNTLAQELFTIYLNPTSLQITNKNNLFLSITGNTVFFAPLNNSIVQIFDYLLGATELCLFVSNTNWSSALQIQSNILSIVPTPSSITNSFSAIALTLVAQNNIENRTSCASSISVTYTNNPTVFTEDLQITHQSTNSNYYQNWLFQFALESPQITTGIARYDIKYHPLKNHQTPLGDYTYEPNTFEVRPGVQRQYTSIFSGGNQTQGFDKVYLGYLSNATPIIFKPDELTSFRFSPTDGVINISSAGFIENGALGGNIPLISDRIYVQHIDYSKQSTNFPIPSSFTQNDGILVCSWLSGNQQTKVWMDRYYNSGYFSLNPLSGMSDYFFEKIKPLKGYIWDEPSQLKLENGVQYQYIHSGPKLGNQLLDLIEHVPHSTDNYKTLGVSAWNVSGRLVDNSNYHQPNYIVNQQYISPKLYFEFDGNSHIIFSAASSLLLPTDFTVSLWVNTQNWDDIQGNQIIGNFDQSGWGLINKQQLIAPLLTLIDQKEAKTYTLNYKLTLTETNNLSAGNYDLICRLPDLSYWVVDTLNLQAYRYDPQQNLLDSKFVPLYLPDQIISDNQSNVYICDKTNQQYTRIDYNSTEVLTASSTDYDFHSMAIDRDNHVIFSTAPFSIVTSDNSLWEVLNGVIFKSTLTNGHAANRKLIAAIGECYGIVADTGNRIYFLLPDSKITCLDTAASQFVWTQQIGKILSIDRYLGIIWAPIQPPDKCNSAPTMQDLLVVVDNTTKEIFVLDNNGLLIYYLNAINLPSLANPEDNNIPNFVLKGDFTGFNSTRLNRQQELVWAIQPQDNLQPIYLPTNQRTLAPGWHLFTLVTDSDEGMVKSYVDSILISASAFNTVVDYQYKSAILLGAASVLSTNLNAIMGIENICKFVGQIADLRVYRKPLSFDVIQQLYWNSPVISIPRPDLVWNMPTGQRNYIEEIQQWFTFNLPGNKSKYFNINIYNFPGNQVVKNEIEESVRYNIEKLIPGYTQLFKINWINA